MQEVEGHGSRKAVCLAWLVANIGGQMGSSWSDVTCLQRSEPKEEKAFFVYLSANTSVAVWVADKKLEGKLLNLTTNT